MLITIHIIFFIRRQYYLSKVQVGVVGGIFFVWIRDRYLNFLSSWRQVFFDKLGDWEAIEENPK
jgi:hypothetical protein